MLIYTHDSEKKLVEILLQEKKEVLTLSAMERSALIEVGNILINAFMGMIAEVLKLAFNFSVPQMFLPSQDLVNQILHAEADAQNRVALLLKSEMRIRETEIIGHLAILMDFETVTGLVERMEQIWISK